MINDEPTDRHRGAEKAEGTYGSMFFNQPTSWAARAFQRAPWRSQKVFSNRGLLQLQALRLVSAKRVRCFRTRLEKGVEVPVSRAGPDRRHETRLHWIVHLAFVA